MTTFKHGDRVTCEIKGTKITDARISIDKDGTPYICQDIVSGADDVNDEFGYKYSWYLSKDLTDCDVTNLKLASPKQLEDIEVGDVLLRGGTEYPVLMRSGEVVVVGLERDYGFAASGNYTIDELRHSGCTVKQEEPVKMTVAQVAEKLGYEVEIVK